MPASRRVDAAPRRASCGGRFRSVLHSRNSVVGGRGKPFHPGLILVVERLVVQPTPAGTGHRLDPSSASSPAPGVDVHERAAEVLVGGRSGFLAHLVRPHISRFTWRSPGTAYPTRRGGFASPAAVGGWAPVRWAWCAFRGRRGVPSAGRRGACRVCGLGGLLRLELRTASISRPASRKVDAAPQRARVYVGVGTRLKALAVIASSISRPGRARPLSLRQSRGPRRREQTRPHGERGRLQGSGHIPWHRLLLPRPSRGLEGRGRRRLVHLEAHVEEGGRGSTESEGIYAAVVASSISRPASRKVNSAHKEQGRIWGLGCVP